MVVDEIGLSIAVEHHIARLEVAIKKALALFRRQILSKKAEVSLQFQLMKFELCGFKKAVFKVVEVEKYTVNIKLRLRITNLPIQSARASYLYVGQFAYNCCKQLFLAHVVPSTRFAATA